MKKLILLLAVLCSASCHKNVTANLPEDKPPVQSIDPFAVDDFSKASAGIDVVRYELNFDFLNVKQSKTYELNETIYLKQVQSHSEIALDIESKYFEIHELSVNDLPQSYTLEADRIVIPLSIKDRDTADLKIKIRMTRLNSGSGDAYSGHNGTQYLLGALGNLDFIITMTQPNSAKTNFILKNIPSDKAIFESSYKVPSEWNVLSNGLLIDSKVDSDSAFFHWRIDIPISNYLFSYVIGTYHVQDLLHAQFPMRHWYPEDAPEYIKGIGRNTVDAMKLFEKLMGPFPFNKYDVSFTRGGAGGAMEHASATTFSWLDDSDYAFDPDSNYIWDTVRSTNVHELAHQWFGNQVTCENWDHLWLNEGFATFMEIISSVHLEGRLRALDKVEEARKAYQDEDADEVNPPIVNHMAGEKMFNANSYQKAGLVIYGIYVKYGEDKFFAAVRTYLQKFKFKTAKTKDFVEVLKVELGPEVEAYINQWMFSQGFPTLDLQVTFENKTLKFVGKSQSKTGKIFKYEVPFKVYLADGSVRDEVLVVNDANPELILPLSEEVKTVAIDPAGVFIGVLNLQVPDAFRAELLKTNLVQSGIRSQIENLNFLSDKKMLSFEGYKTLVASYPESFLYLSSLFNAGNSLFADRIDLKDFYWQKGVTSKYPFGVFAFNGINNINIPKGALADKIALIKQLSVSTKNPAYGPSAVLLLAKDNSKEAAPLLRNLISKYVDQNASLFQFYSAILLKENVDEYDFVVKFLKYKDNWIRGRAALAIADTVDTDRAVVDIGEAAMIEKDQADYAGFEHIGLMRMVNALIKLKSQPKALVYLKQIRSQDALPEEIAKEIDENIGVTFGALMSRMNLKWDDSSSLKNTKYPVLPFRYHGKRELNRFQL